MKWFIRLVIVAAIAGVVVLLVTRRQRSPMPEIEYAAPPSEAPAEAVEEAAAAVEDAAEAVEETVEEGAEETAEDA